MYRNIKLFLARKIYVKKVRKENLFPNIVFLNFKKSNLSKHVKHKHTNSISVIKEDKITIDTINELLNKRRIMRDEKLKNENT